MLHIYQSNLTETLLDGLIQVLRQPTLETSLLSTEAILVQNPDMAQWLKMELAASQGIAANMEFPLPSSFLWRIFHALFVGELPEESPFAKEKLCWHVMKLLPELRLDADFSWLQDDLFIVDDPMAQLSLYELSGMLADTLDQYLMYRPDWVAAWEEGELVEGLPESQNWQAKLWQKLVEKISGQTGCDLHRGRLLQKTIEKLEQSDHLPLPGLPKRISLFGISAMPEQMLLLLNALGKQIEIHWFQLNPCQEFWLDIIDERTRAKLAVDSRYIHLDDLSEDRYFLVGNPLLASLGQLGREHLSLMYEKVQGDWQEQFDDYPTQNALNLLQQEILHLHCRGQFEPLTAEQLSSNEGKWQLREPQLENIRYHVCYSPMRELEVLKDQLLFLFEQEPGLTPNDVLVMMPDVGAYASYIHAIFSERRGEPYIPFSVNDLSAVQESPLIDSFLNLLKLPESRFHLSELLSLLEVPAVMRRFTIDGEELERIKHWLRETGVRWGRDAQQREQLGVGSFEANSWGSGLRRMLTGYAMHPEQGLFDEQLPYDEIEGKGAIALGKLLMFYDALELTRQQLEEPLSPELWSQQLSQIIQRFYLPESSETLILQRISESCERLTQSINESGYSQPLGYSLLHHHLVSALSLSVGGRRFRAGAVNFCTLMPMRSIPFKVICLLGMNDGDFPRSISPSQLDLTLAQRRRGDRSRRLDDRYLFLEALLSCRTHLHISWVGRDIRDDSELPPSILVSELRDYMSEAWMLAGDDKKTPEKTGNALLQAMTQEHPLQAYHPSYFKAGQPTSYARLWADSLNAHHEDAPQQAIDVEWPEQVELSQLEAMLTNPCKQFLQRQASVYFDEVAQDDEDTEPFDLGPLESWQLKQSAMEDALHTSVSPVDFATQSRHSGLLPVAEAGEQQIANAQEAVKSLVLTLNTLQASKHTEMQELRCPLTVQGKPILLVGFVSQALGEHQLRFCSKPGSLKGRDLMRGWLRHLLACATSELPSVMCLLDSDSARLFDHVQMDVAQKLLTDYLELYIQGLSRPLPFFMQSSLVLAELMDESDDVVLKALQKSWLPAFGGIPGEGDDPYIARCYSEPSGCLDEFKAITQQLVSPMLAQLMINPLAKKPKPVFSHSELLEHLGFDEEDACNS